MNYSFRFLHIEYYSYLLHRSQKKTVPLVTAAIQTVFRLKDIYVNKINNVKTD